MKHIRHLATLLLLGLTLVGCSHSTACATDAPCTRVLFVGNSYTFANDLPGAFAKLAASGGHRVSVGVSATGGASLSEHASSPDTKRMLTSAQWDDVVLQEQSEIPSLASPRASQMFPAARKLVQAVETAGAHPVFFDTWAHRDGLPQSGLATYEKMQSAIDDAYLAIAGEQHATVAPVGFAWLTASGSRVGTGLWDGDGSHPSARGTYLAACVFFATLFRESPVGLAYLGGLPQEEATYLQQVARDTVLGSAGRWNLAALARTESADRQ